MRRLPAAAIAGIVVGGWLLFGNPAAAAPKYYDLDRFLTEPHPFAGAGAGATAAAAATAPIGVEPTRQFAGGGIHSNGRFRSHLYNMDFVLNQKHPFSARFRPIFPIEPVQPRSRIRSRAIPSPARPPEPLDARPGGLSEDDLDNDPLEPMNRFFFGFNEVLTKLLLGPVARGYNAVLPDSVRTALENFFDNLNLPVVLANDLLQGEFRRAGDTSVRLVVNSIAGIGGFIDVAEKFGFEPHSEDFGQTLAVWGLGEGFYLVLPVFGPSSPRDAVGKLVVDPYFDPLSYYLNNTDQDEISYARTGVGGLVELADVIADLDRLRETSVDFYGALRSLYRQRRMAEIGNNKSQEVPNFDVDLQ